ncbi:hypothetical protein IMCC26134_14630 [Verrucomicrobia bacterium IMCC26134]|nr:hypothetical protein IMCC26134_14630 [Verrucomicrobia bacterium IMCC26134]
MYSQAVTRTAQDVFGRWIQWQKILADLPLAKASLAIDDAFWERFTLNRCAPHHPLGSPALLFFNEAFTTDRAAALHELHALFDHDLPGLLEYLKANGLLSPAIDSLEAGLPVGAVIDKYRRFADVIYDFTDPALKAAACFALGNRIFDFCLGAESHEAFRSLLARTEDRPFARLLHSLLWQHLSADGWRDWHLSCLEALRAQSLQGRTVVYPAGGCDFYQLLRHGIYNIEVIDPFLPSQGDYYSEGWSWLISAQTLGDCITIPCGDHGLVLRRESHQSLATFEALLSTGETAVLERCKVCWGVYSDMNERRLGTLTLHRRFTETHDFAADESRAVLVSFNELFLFATSRERAGWGLDLDSLDPSRVLHVKQLRAPASIETLCRLRAAEALPFHFINLGSCAT